MLAGGFVFFFLYVTMNKNEVIVSSSKLIFGAISFSTFSPDGNDEREREQERGLYE